MTLLRPITAAIALAVLFAVVLVARGGDDSHRVVVRIADATNVINGQKIREGGVQVGHVAGIESVAIGRGRGAELELDIDDAAWPLPTDSRFLLRWGGTVKFGDRYIALTRGRAQTELSDGAQLAATQFAVPVEFDQLLGTFDKPTRASFTRFLDNAGATLTQARPALRSSLKRSPEALDQADALLTDIDAGRLRLSSILRSGSRVINAADTAEPDIGQLVTGAATTMRALADREQQLGQTLDEAPRTFTHARDTLAKADPTLRRTGTVVAKLAPGVQEVRRLARPLNRLITTVTTVAPQATGTLRTARRATPDVNPLLQKLTERAPQIESIAKRTSKELDCVRPYTPEIISFFTNWGSFTGGYDGKDRYVRANIQLLPFAPANVMDYDTETAVKLFPGIRYGMPRPPGALAGQPWYLPECKAGLDAVDPAKDPESRKGGR
ncbi:hypothetical protein DSM112329_00341 [Paraconexibacter sp. AEG42_29]|uniref:Mce/MlaD domain-containing protein n=1 Tax=Paraconexibacter sp. AEG42_29 TaxID=2997339 RepID=A0AAU7APC2_9ACTN